MVRRSQSSNPRSPVVLSGGADWRTRAAGQQRTTGAELTLPRKQSKRIKVLGNTIEALRVAINAERPAQARFLLSRAGALVRSIPASEISGERRQLPDLRKKFAATTAKTRPSTAKKPAPKPSAPSPKPKQPAPKTARKPAKRPPQPARVPDLGDRYINRAALGYSTTSTDKR